MSAISHLSALISGPLLARALGPAGRGAVAAVIATGGLVGALAVLGLGEFVNRELARGRSTGLVLGSLFPILAAVGLLVMIAGIPLAGLVSNGRSDIRLLLILTFSLSPLLLPASLLPSAAVGRSDWDPLLVSRLIVPIGGTAAYVVLYLVEWLTVNTAVVTLLSLSVLSYAPFLPLLRSSPLVANPRTMREGLRFGAGAWAGSALLFANHRLDQVIMASLTTPQELGYYAVAVSVTSVTAGFIASAVGASLQPRVAAGDVSLIPQATRVTIWLVAAVSGALGVGLPFLLPLLFGDEFSPAVPVAHLLLIAGIPLAGLAVLGPAIVSSGRPLVIAVAEGIALILSLPLLLALVTEYGAEAAATISIATYAISFSFLLRHAKRVVGAPFRRFLIPRGDDAQWLWSRLRRTTTLDQSPLGRPPLDHPRQQSGRGNGG